MNAPLRIAPTGHQIARDEIDGWRGRCIDYFARIEKRTGVVLAEAISCGFPVKQRPLAGPRLSEIETLRTSCPGTAKQESLLTAAIDGWKSVEPRRTFIAHGELTVLLDQRGIWNARFDLTRFKRRESIDERWTLTRDEAAAFELMLKRSFEKISQQLGLLRKRLGN